MFECIVSCVDVVHHVKTNMCLVTYGLDVCTSTFVDQHIFLKYIKYCCV